MVNFNILAGGSGAFILNYFLNPDAGTLTVQGNFTTGTNPSWIALNPTNKSVLYAVNELEKGAVQSFSIGQNGTLSPPVDTVSTNGNGPPFVDAFSNGLVAAPNFGGGNAEIIKTTTDPLHFDQSPLVITFDPPPNVTSKPHAVYQHDGEFLIPDLGADKIWRLNDTETPGTFKVVSSIDHAKGSGPRHCVVKDDKIITVHELDNSLTSHSLVTSQLLANVSVAPSDASVPKGAKFAAAEVLYPPPLNGSTDNFIFASNRNVGDADSRGDSIAIIQHIAGSETGTARSTSRRRLRRVNEELKVVAQVFTGLNQIRSMAFSPDGMYLVAGGSKVGGGGGIKVYRRTDGGKGLEEVAKNGDEDTRTAFVWV